MKRTMNRTLCILVAAAFCWAIPFAPMGRAVAAERTFSQMLDQLAVYLDNDHVADTVSGKNGDAPLDLMREALLACGDAFASYQEGSIFYRKTLGFLGFDPSADATRFCDLLSTYGSSYHGDATMGWEKLADAFLPVLGDARLDGGGRVFAEDLYASCCAAGLWRPFNDQKNFAAYYAAHIAPVNDTEKTRILDEIADGDANIPNLPLNVVAVYAKDGKANCVSDKFIAYMLAWRCTLSVYLVALTELHAQGIDWVGLFDQVERIEMARDSKEYASMCAQILAFPLLQKDVSCDLAALGNQFCDVRGYVTFEDAIKISADMPPEMQERLRISAKSASPSEPNLNVRWPKTAVSQCTPFASSGDGFILISTEGNEYFGEEGAYSGYSILPENRLSATSSRIQCWEVSELLSGTATHVFNPKDARIALEFCCTYDDAGTYTATSGDTGSLKAYNCAV